MLEIQYKDDDKKIENIPVSFHHDKEEEESSEEENEEEKPLISMLEEKKNINNSLFGFIPWKSTVAHRPLESRSEVVRNLYQDSPKITNKGFPLNTSHFVSS